MTAVTYAEARAACVARYGREPDDEGDRGDGLTSCWWPRVPGQPRHDPAGVVLVSDADGTELAVEIMGGAESWPATDAATLAAAMDAADAAVIEHHGAPMTTAADAFLRTHATAAKGP